MDDVPCMRVQVKAKEVLAPPRTYEYNDTSIQPNYLNTTTNQQVQHDAASTMCTGWGLQSGARDLMRANRGGRVLSCKYAAMVCMTTGSFDQEPTCMELLA